MSTEQIFVDSQRVAALLLLRHRLQIRKQRIWVHPINEWRQEQRTYHNLVQKLGQIPRR